MWMQRQRTAGCILLFFMLLAACAPMEEKSAEEWADGALNTLQDSSGHRYVGQWQGSRGGHLVYENEAMLAAESESVWQPVVPPDEIGDWIAGVSYRTDSGHSEYVVVDIAMDRARYTEAMRARMLKRFDELASLNNEEMQSQQAIHPSEREWIEALWQQVEVDAVYTMWIRRASIVPEQVEVEARLHYTSGGKNMQEIILSRYTLQPDGTRLVPEEA